MPNVASEFQPAPEPIVGEPEVIRTERQELSPESSQPYLREIERYHRDRQISERLVYAPDGAVSYRELYARGTNGESVEATMLDESGALVRRRTTHILQTGAQETLTVDAAGTEVERVVSRFDDAGRLLESTSTGGPHAMRIDLQVTYGAGIEPREARVTFSQPGGPSRVVRFHFEAGQIASTSFEGQGASAPPVTVHRIDSRDEHGNWMEMTILTSRPAVEALQPTAIVRRSIQYDPPL